MVENQGNLTGDQGSPGEAQGMSPPRDAEENQLAPLHPSDEQQQGEPAAGAEDLEETAEYVPQAEEGAEGLGQTEQESVHGAADSDGADEGDDGELDELDDDEEDEAEPAPAPTGPIELIEDDEEDLSMDWYILKVQSNRERSIAAALQRKVAIEGLDRFFGEILVPTEKVTEFKGGKKKVVERKVWPGYIAVQMHVNDDTWFAIRETSGIGDFTGAGGKPTPMAAQDVAKILHTEEEETDEAPRLAIPFKEGDKVKVKEGNFESFEGDVSKIDAVHGKVTVMLSIFGRPTPVELEYWQVELV